MRLLVGSAFIYLVSKNLNSNTQIFNKEGEIMFRFDLEKLLATITLTVGFASISFKQYIKELRKTI